MDHECATGPDRIEPGDPLLDERLLLPLIGVERWLLQYRPDPEALRTEPDTLMCEGLKPYLAKALEVSRALRSFRKVLPRLLNESDAVVVAALDGRIRFAQHAAPALLATEWPHFDGDRLPESLLEASLVEQHEDVVGAAIACSVHRSADAIVLTLRRCSELDRLPGQRRRIARLYAAGSSYKQIARAMRLSPSTVRNQIKAIYDTLGIGSKPELVAVAGRRTSVLASPGSVPIGRHWKSSRGPVDVAFDDTT